ncbi:AAA family ATPase, partial [Francisella tularensis subsp. holarctica]|nr:AAA family ATPase [Francisella tularensis subsp. holarctica]
MPLKKLNIITGVNASGKSNLYKSLRLVSETAEGGVIHSLAKEGGLNTTFWAGPEKISRQMIKGEVAIQGNSKHNDDRLRLGFADDLFGYSISLGSPEPSLSAFSLDPEIKRVTILAG